MEVIGAVSSVVTLAETTIKLAKGLTHLAQRWHNAPEEILALAHATSSLATKFAFVESTITNSPNTLIDDIPRQGLMELVLKAKTVTNELEVLYKRLDSYQTILQKARWAVKDARTVKSALAMIKDIEEGLSMWINFVSLKGHGMTLHQFEETQRIVTAGFAEMRQMFSGLAITHPSNLPLVATSRTGSTSIAASASTTTFDPIASAATQTAIIRKFEAISWKASQILQSWGMTGSVVKSTQGHSTEYDFGFNAHLPLSWLFGNYALRGQLSIRKSSLVSNTFTLRHPSYFTVARILERSHPFLKACQFNDLVTVRTMLRNGEGRPTDVNSHGETCLWYAIRSGSMDVAIYLLDNGAAVDEVVSSSQKTPLLVAAACRDIDMIRMLLSRGASLDHFDVYGCDAVETCIALIDYVEQPMAATVDVLKVLSDYASLDTSSREHGGNLNLAARYSRAREIDFLVSLGHKVNDYGDVRSVIYRAARGGNSATYFALLAHGAATEFLTENLLIVINAKAALFGEVACHNFGPPGDFDPILRDLLGRRADLLTSLCLVDGKFMDILGPAIPLQEAAKACGLSTEAWFLGLLQECGRETEDDRRRLQELRTGGYDQHGTVIGEVDEESDYDSTDEDSENASSESGQSSAQSEADDTEDEECFWDAEEGA